MANRLAIESLRCQVVRRLWPAVRHTAPHPNPLRTPDMTAEGAGVLWGTTAEGVR